MFDPVRFQQLMDGYVDLDLSKDEMQELDRLLQNSARAREQFWQHTLQHAAAREWALKRQAAVLMAEPDPPARRWSWRRVAWVGAAFSLLVLGGVLWLWWPRPSFPPEPAALLAATTQAVWAPGSPILPERGAALPPGVFHLRQGQAQLDFYSGARVILAAPTSFELVSGMEMRLLSGRLHAEVPPPARGFTVQASGYTIVDLGTEFGVALEEEGSNPEVHVFQGEVAVREKAAPWSRPAKILKKGEAFQTGRADGKTEPAQPGLFPQPAAQAAAIRSENTARQTRWQKAAEQTSRAPGTMIHYLFDRPGETRLRNTAAHAAPETDGIIIGGEWVEGRWPGKSALAFRRPNDRIRLVLPGQYTAMTLTAWIRLEERPAPLVGLLRTDEFLPGVAHWNLDERGSLRLGIMTGEKRFIIPPAQSTGWEVAVAPPLLLEKQGQWVHLATTYDSASREVIHYVNGKSVSTYVVKHPLPITFGKAHLGNGPQAGHLPGRMDEFTLYDRALPVEEVRALYEAHHPSAPVQKP